MKNKFSKIKLAQMPPMGGMPPPPMGGAPAPGGMPPTPTDPMAAPGGAPPPAPAAPPQRQEIPGPIDNLSKLLYDDKITDLIDGSEKKPEDLAEQVWQDYGGTDKGQADPQKVGTRTEADAQKPQEQVVAENAKTEHTKWIRLPQGKTVADVTSLEEITDGMTAMVAGNSKQMAQQSAPQGGGEGGGGGAPPALASLIQDAIKTAQSLDSKNLFLYADRLDTILNLGEKNMNKANIIKQIASVASDLDQRGLLEEADTLDKLASSLLKTRTAQVDGGATEWPQSPEDDFSGAAYDDEGVANEPLRRKNDKHNAEIQEIGRHIREGINNAKAEIRGTLTATSYASPDSIHSEWFDNANAVISDLFKQMTIAENRIFNR